jgi:hypothetical protein
MVLFAPRLFGRELISQEEKPDLHIKATTRHDSSIDPDTQGLSLKLAKLAIDTAQYWELCEKRALQRALHPEQTVAEDTLSSTRNPAGKALETPRTATTHTSTVYVSPHGDDDSQLACSVDQPSTVDLVKPLKNFDNRIFESQCESDQTFYSKVCFPCALDAKLTDLGRMYSSNDGNHRWQKCAGKPGVLLRVVRTSELVDSLLMLSNFPIVVTCSIASVLAMSVVCEQVASMWCR